jgi:putative flippase GtrA
VAEFLRFCIVGGIAFLVDAAILEFLVLGEVPASTARVISIAIALQVSYLLHRRFTFSARHPHSTRRWGKFMAANLIGAVINYSTFLGLLAAALSADADTARALALLGSTFVALMFNYWANRRLVFAHETYCVVTRFGISIGWLTVIAIAAVHLAYALSKWHAIPLEEGMPMGQTDPDSWLRLTLVRDWLLGGSWFDHNVVNSNSPYGGTISPWTRPLDLIIAALAFLQPEVVEINLRLMRASLLLPVLWMALLVLGIHRAIRAFLPLPSAYAMAGVMVVTLPMLWNYFSLGNADHHALLAVLFIWAMGGVLNANPSRRLMVFTGLLLGLQLWVSVESLMLIALIYSWYGLCWLRGDDRMMQSLSWLASITALSTLLALMIERPAAEWHLPIYDSISIVHVFALTLAALLAWGLRVVRARYMAYRLGYAMVGGAAMLLALALTYPKFFYGPMVDVHPFILSDFLPRISEAKPFYKVSLPTVLSMVFVPSVALALCMAAWLRPANSFYTRDTARMLAFFVIGTVLLYLAQQRWSYYLLPLSMVAVAPFLAALFTPEHALVTGRWPASMLIGLAPGAQAKRRMPISLAILGLPFVLLLIGSEPELPANAPADPTNATYASRLLTAQRDNCYRAARVLIRSGELQRLMPNPSTILVPTDLGTEILFFTHHRIIASNYHREGEGIAYVWRAEQFTDAPALRAHLAARKIGTILMCPTVEPTKGSVLHGYVHGEKLPEWMTRISYALPTPADKNNQNVAQMISPLIVQVRY